MKNELTVYARKITRARLVLGWERAWRLAWPVAACVLLFAGVALLDILPRLAPWLHGTLLALFVIGLGLTAARLRHFEQPSRQDAQRRLEADNRLTHRPLSQLDDRPATLSADGTAEDLWRLQRRRGLALLGTLRLAPPAPGLPARDPLGLRFAPLLVLAVGLAVGRHDPGDRLIRALDPGIDGQTPAPLLQIWVTPPAYTGLQPILLEPNYQGAAIRIPAGSTLLAELQGAAGDARLVLDNQRLPFARLDAQSQKLETELTTGHALSVRAGWRRLGHWPIAMIPDQPPAVAFLAPPAARPDGTLRLKIAARDDYGLETLGLILTRRQAGGGETEIRLPGGGQKEVLLDQPLDLTAHPWSGLSVTLRPVARDGAGQSAEGEAVEMVLPERSFRHPVARAIAETRRHLIEDPTGRGAAAQTIAEIANRPESWGGDLTVFLDLATARARLSQDASETAIPSVLDMLWAAAIRIEQGDVQDARDAVDQAAQALKDALGNGASDTEISQLTRQLNQAVGRLMHSLDRQTADNPPPSSQGGHGQTITPQQVQAMLNQMNDLAQSGARQAAKQSLEQLRSLLGQLHAGGGMSAGGGKMAESLQQLDELGEKQRALLDRAFRRGQQPDGRQDGLKADQQAESALQQQLRHLMEQTLGAGEDAPALGQALRAMEQAGQALRQGEGEAAQQAESRALDRLQEGARQIGKALEQAGEEGQGGESGRDPLGRGLSGQGGIDGKGVKIPSQGDLGKAREILDDLRRRAADADRPPAERDYLRRLLDKLY